jgi:sugar transferase (PEP-CTERM/EpsH1 system associated)
LKILFLTSRFPFPLEKGDKLRAFHFIKSLSRHADIYLFAVNEKKPDEKMMAELSKYCKAIDTGVITKTTSIRSMSKAAFNKRMPFQVAYFYHDSIMKQLNAFVDKHQPDAVFCHLIRMSEYARQLPIHPAMLDYMDTFSLGMDRMLEKSAMLMKLPVKSEASRLKHYEHDIFKHFDQHIIISAQDRDHIPHPENKKIGVVANGVDLEFYKEEKSEKKYDLLFIGNMSYPPNISSAVFAAKEILPELHRLHPHANLLIAGAEPTTKVKQLAGKNIIVSGWVDDVRITFAESRIMIAPMLISIGLQNKILQAMAMRTPCVITSTACNALGATPEEEVLIADDPRTFATQIDRLLNDEVLREKISENAYRYVHAHFDWDRNTDAVLQLFQNASKQSR